MAMMNEMEYRTIGSALAGGYRAAVYCRLSKDDDLQGESASIANQRDMLEKYCEKQGWEVVAVYQDDGFTGLNMERPDLQRMLRAIERRQINLVITKDLSRLGRNYLQTGHLIEHFFPSCRLSKDDDLQGESASIANQRDMLEKYCEKQGWEVVAVYQDDGFTGLNMERPDLQRMLRAIERRQINLVITKDLSRLGRNYLQTGHLIEHFFPRNGVLYIAMNDGIDTLRDNNDIAPFKNILNEMYSKDISKNVHSSYLLKAQKGQFTGCLAINLVITKDLSRLGRNYLQTGHLIEDFFPRNGVRYIAMNDGIDTLRDNNDIAPFKNILNEMYSKDISKKVHSSYLLKAQKGQFTGCLAPFGYRKDPLPPLGIGKTRRTKTICSLTRKPPRLCG